MAGYVHSTEQISFVGEEAVSIWQGGGSEESKKVEGQSRRLLVHRVVAPLGIRIWKDSIPRWQVLGPGGIDPMNGGSEGTGHD